MSDQRGLLAADAPAFDATAFRGSVGVDKPVEQPGVLSQAWTVSQNAAGYNELQEAEQQTAVERAYDPIIAELERRGIKGGYKTSFLGSDPFYNEGRIFDGIARAREIDPSAFKDVPDDPQAFRAKAAAPVAAKYAERNQIEANSGWAPWLIGQFAGSLSDPINLVGMLDGATEARTIAQAALRDAAVNAKLTAMQMPANAIAAARNGRETTPGATAEELAIAGLTGAAGGAAIKGGAQLLGKTPWGKLADQVRDAVPPDRRTAHEDAAVATLDRTDETLRASPFRSGPGSDAHMARMDAAMRTLADPPPADAPVSRETSAPPRFDFSEYAIVAGRAESGNDWRRQAEGSSAFGRWQLTHDTFVQFSGGGEAGERAWANRTNPALQQQAFQNLTRHNRAVLARIGAPESYGNLYLLHFAGEGAGARILEAAPDAPIERLVSTAAVKANPWLKGMTAEEVRAWAARKMGEAPHEGPVLRRELFGEDAAGDAEFAAAQRAVDAAEAQRAANDAGGALGTAGERDPFDPRGWADDDGSAWTPVEGEAPAPPPIENGALVVAQDTSPAPIQDDWMGRIDAGKRRYQSIIGNLWQHSPDELERLLAQSVEAEKNGIREAFKKAGVEPSPAMRRIFDREPDAWSFDRASAKAEREITNVHGELPEDIERILQPHWEDQGANGLPMSDDIAELLRTGTPSDESAHMAASEMGWALRDTLEDDFSTVGAGGADIRTQAAFLRARGAYEHLLKLGHQPDGIPTLLARAMIDNGVDPHTAAELTSIIVDTLRGNREAPGARAAEPAQLAAPHLALPDHSGGVMPDVDGFDHPDDIAAARQADSLEHDIAMMLEADPEMTVQLDDEGKPINAREALADADGDLAALDRAEACLAPPKGGTT